MELKDKIFSFGIYGKNLSFLTIDEFNQVKNEPWAEILSIDQLQSFKENFTVVPFERKIDNTFDPSKYYLRMNMNSWRTKIFGDNFRTTNKLYFFILDYLLKSGGYVSISTLREKFNIDPKTMFYICKKLVDQEIIEEIKLNREVKIKLAPLKESTRPKDKPTTELPKFNLKTIKFYNNVSFLAQLKLHVKESQNGFDTEDFFYKCGIRKKIGLKYIFKVCEIYPNELKLVDTINNKHTAYKCFSLENLEKRNQKKVEYMQGNIVDGDVDMLLTSKDRQEALKMIANKMGHFSITKDIINEIKQITGYQYDIDKKNLIVNAKAAGLKVFKILLQNNINKVVIALPEFNEDIFNFYLSSGMSKENRIFYNKMCKYFLNIESCIVEDNGYSSVRLEPLHYLYRELIKQEDSETSVYTDFDYESVMNMAVKSFYKIIKISSLNFRARCAFDIYKNHPEIFKDIKISCNDFYSDGKDPKTINSDVFLLQDKLDSLSMKEYTSKLSEYLQNMIREFVKPKRFLKKLKMLQNKNLIDLKVANDNRITYTTKNSKSSFATFSLENNNEINQKEAYEETGNLDINTLQYCKKLLNYNQRCHFLHLMEDSNENNFLINSKNVIESHFANCFQKNLHEYCYNFMKIRPQTNTPKNNCLFTLSTKDHEKTYLDIKKSVIFKNGFNVIDNTSGNVDYIEDLLDYMAKKHIIAGFNPRNKIINISIGSRFKDYIGNYKLESLQDECDSKTYYSLFFKKISDIVHDHRSIDFDELLSKIKYFEPFELDQFLELYKDSFIQTRIEGFIFISAADQCDPFS